MNSNLQLLKQKEMVYGLPELIEEVGVCAKCATGKQDREAFSRESTWRADMEIYECATRYHLCGNCSIKRYISRSHLKIHLENI